MCHIKPSSKYFATLDLCSGYHQIAVYEESSGLMVNHNKMKVLAKGISSARDIFNLLTDGDIRLDSQMLKNMDNLLILGDPLLEINRKNEHFWRLAKKKNLKLKTFKFRISEKVKFGGSVVSEDVVNILSKNGRIKAFVNWV